MKEYGSHEKIAEMLKTVDKEESNLRDHVKLKMIVSWTTQGC